MTTLLDVIGPAVWRASWQAVVLALVVVLTLWLLGERMQPRWRYLLWGVVVARLLFIVTPASPWSMFNLVSHRGEPSPQRVQHITSERTATAGRPDESNAEQPIPRRDVEPDGAVPQQVEPTPALVDAQVSAAGGSAAVSPSSVRPSAIEAPPSKQPVPSSTLVTRGLSFFWLAGCLVLAARLLATTLALRRRLSVCRPVTEPDILRLLEATCARLGLRRTPVLLVTPEPIIPCTAAAWNPRIIVPESLVTEPSRSRLRHVLAHESAHLVRGDVWTNWLLLAARGLHWFNPVAWWVVREMQFEREAACDELAVAALGEADRSVYANTIVELAAGLAPPEPAPGLVGLFSSARRLTLRVTRLLRSPSVRPLKTPLAAGLVLGFGVLGLTDALPSGPPVGPAVSEQPEEPAEPSTDPKQNADGYVIGGRCVDREDESPLAGVRLRLFSVRGLIGVRRQVAETVSGDDGRFEFTDLEPPREEAHWDSLRYYVIPQAEGRPMLVYSPSQQDVLIRIPRKRTMLTGRVTDQQGRPVPGALVMSGAVAGRPMPGEPLTTLTDAQGRFQLADLPAETRVYFRAVHPDYPSARGNVADASAEVEIRLPDGCTLTGNVLDGATGEPARGVVVSAERLNGAGEVRALTDAAGHYRLVVEPGTYNIVAESEDRVSVAVVDQECRAGETIELPPFRMVEGGFISGAVVDASTGKPVVLSRGNPITIGLFGPSHPSRGRYTSPKRLAEVDEAGRFLLRAAPGDNFPYLVNTRGDRMAWDTKEQPPVVVKEGETTVYYMLITPPDSPEEKLKAARAVVEALSENPSERVAQIILEFRKLNHTVDETELWTMLMRELVAVGPDAVPQLSAELDRTTSDRMLRRLGFALRAIGDPRAVPALIRAIPRSLQPPSSDYGLIVPDAGLAAFMRKHQLGKSGGTGTYFSFGRPVREICGALHKLTGLDLDDIELYSISLSEDPRRAALQKRIYERQAVQWQKWWEADWRDFTADAAYSKVNLQLIEEPLPPARQTLGPNARLGSGMQGATISPAAQGGEHAWHFYDLDTGYRPRWPVHIPKDEDRLDEQQLARWAAENGVDLMCVTYRAADGTETFVLRAFDMKVREISPDDAQIIDKLVARGTLPEGREVGELLMHYDAQAQESVPDADATFLFTTREGNRGLIETTDRVTRTANLTGSFGSPPAGVGFHKGVRFNMKPIIP